MNDYLIEKSLLISQSLEIAIHTPNESRDLSAVESWVTEIDLFQFGVVCQ